jgi:hypothetical protein
MKKAKTITISLLSFTIFFVLSSTRAESFDAEAISQISEGIAEWNLINEIKNKTQMEEKVYVSSSLGGKVTRGNGQGIGVIIGLTAFDEWRPVQNATDFYYAQKNIAITSAGPDNWIWQGMKATGYEIAGKYIEHFPFLNPISIEQHTVEIIDPMNKYSPVQKVGAIGALSWDIASPFASNILKTTGTNLLKQQANVALSAQNLKQFDSSVTQLYRSTVFLDRGIQTYKTIDNLGNVYTIGGDAFRLGNSAMREFGVIRPNTGAMPNITSYPPPNVLFSIKDPLFTYTSPTFKMPTYSPYSISGMPPAYNPTIPSSYGGRIH